MQHLEGFWMYKDAILDEFGNGRAEENEWYSAENYKRWRVRHSEDARTAREGFQRANGMTVTPGGSGSDDWSKPGSPYDL